jgi:hypothetical protein
MSDDHKEYQKVMGRYLIDTGTCNAYEAAMFLGDAIRDRISRDGTWYPEHTHGYPPERQGTGKVWQYKLLKRQRTTPQELTDEEFAQFAEEFKAKQTKANRLKKALGSKAKADLIDINVDAEREYQEKEKQRKANARPREHESDSFARVIEEKPTGLLPGLIHEQNASDETLLKHGKLVAAKPKKASYYKKKKEKEKKAHQNLLENYFQDREKRLGKTE